MAIARDQVANGAVILDVNMDEAMLDGVAAMTRYLRRLGLGARHRGRARHGRQLQVVGDRGRAAAAPGPAGRELDLAQGGRGRVPAPGEAVPPLRRRRGGDGVRRGGPGRFGRPPGRGPDPGVPAADRAGRVRARRHHPRPQHLRDRHRHRGARPLRDLVLRGDAPPQGGAPGGADQRRRVQRVLRVPRQRPRPRGDPRRVPVPRHPRRPRHGHRQRRCPAAVRRHRPGPAGAGGGRGPRPAARRDRPPARDRAAIRGRRRGHPRRRRPRLAGPPGRRAPDARAGRGDRRLDRRGHRGGAARHRSGRSTSSRAR